MGLGTPPIATVFIERQSIEPVSQRLGQPLPPRIRLPAFVAIGLPSKTRNQRRLAVRENEFREVHAVRRFKKGILCGPSR